MTMCPRHSTSSHNSLHLLGLSLKVDQRQFEDVHSGLEVSQKIQSHHLGTRTQIQLQMKSSVQPRLTALIVGTQPGH